MHLDGPAMGRAIMIFSNEFRNQRIIYRTCLVSLAFIFILVVGCKILTRHDPVVHMLLSPLGTCRIDLHPQRLP